MSGAGLGKGLIILDRDGVINHDSEAFIKNEDEWRPIPGSLEAIAALTKAGFTLAIASNQSGIARGLFDQAALDAMHAKMLGLVHEAGGHISRIVFCPHGPNEGCDCRKPRPGLLEQLAKHFDTSLAGVPVVGDALRDLEAAAAAGARPVLVRSGKGRKTEAALPERFAGVAVYDDLAAAARALIDEVA
ncbi:MAG: D-glycero-beta-D-manno-heptose 1,7-bisphosphate 7-phosphatase [Gammaproteobacteria bacterium]|jgi:D-glycero-D-manno-heptose 1,7-bisphosphate phosphatase|nr:D-glycero-beta-D-manno-heptose 1,7-bisphosphate 7-phosphatase [Gammaproteobacteria bacterium]MDH3758268.1 D-glycero-beta-D-manno-heptose 1,7-bisphosphate 7-phosphatase [Gammaproteobacteria bacterium]MDH3847436.1 D-glycero-beta-D-manno-heptose 1,7-bisphosphate 7-phosphatase [Gammaproteobacteria bacterium]MDH3904024.1 D-glycero-beta-D-manno-heptose 1,7-bisphosphate 7-phosphatase [Gammaproteobacteria bacterium]MDH3952878.1 D-glycero-beta-D-manno-heptose 1,7-bisphosphate 7-phosphatase [Gammaprot